MGDRDKEIRDWKLLQAPLRCSREDPTAGGHGRAVTEVVEVRRAAVGAGDRSVIENRGCRHGGGCRD